MSDIKLKPCPFCGAPGKILFSSFQGTRPNGCGPVTFDMDIGCSSCWVRYRPVSFRPIFSFDLSFTGDPVVCRDDRQELAEAWNRRAEG